MTIKLTMEMLNDNKGHLGQLDVSVHEIGQVWEIQAKGELLVKPARLVKVRSWNQAIDFFFQRFLNFRNVINLDRRRVACPRILSPCTPTEDGSAGGKAIKSCKKHQNNQKSPTLFVGLSK